MKGNEITVEEIGELLTTAIFSESIIDKKAIHIKIVALIKGFIKQQNAPKQNRSKVSEQHYINIIHKEKIEKKFWRDKYRQMITDDVFKDMCDVLNIELNKLPV